MRVPNANAEKSGAMAVNPVGNALDVGPRSRAIMISTGKELFPQESMFSIRYR
jgi:hypothetical protein